ncbi:unnamed protein product [Phaeothamnion confervicola]
MEAAAAAAVPAAAEAAPPLSPVRAPVATTVPDAQPVEPFEVSSIREFLSTPLPERVGVLECIMVRRKSLMATTFEMYYEPTMRLLLTARREKGKYALTLGRGVAAESGQAPLIGKLRAASRRRQYTIVEYGRPPVSGDGPPPKREVGAVGIELVTQDGDGPGPRGVTAVIPMEWTPPPATARAGRPRRTSMVAALDADEPDGGAGGGGGPPLLRLVSSQPEWEKDLGYFVLEFHRDRIKRQSVKNFLLRTADDAFVLQFGRVDAKDTFALDFQNPLSPLQAFATALASCDSDV